MKKRNEKKILSVQDYLNFSKQVKTLPGNLNRPISPSHVDKMKDIMKLEGFTDRILLIETDLFKSYSTFLRIDGNHRHESIKLILEEDPTWDETIAVCIIKCNSLDEIIQVTATCNNTQKVWTLAQYLNTWCEAGLKDYLFIKEVRSKYDITLSSLIDVYNKMRDYSKLDFKQGTFIANKERGDHVIGLYGDLVLAGLAPNKSSFPALNRFLSRFIDEKVLRSCILRYRTLFNQRMGRDKYIQLFQEYYTKELNRQENQHVKDAIRRTIKLNEMDENNKAS